MIKFYISVDVGLDGGICLRSTKGDFGLYQMPLIKKIKQRKVDFKSLYKILLFFKGKNAIVGFEKLQGIFGTSKIATWGLAEQVGQLKGLCTALGLRFIEIEPKEWQSVMFSGIEKYKRLGKGGKDKTEVVNDTKTRAYFSFLRQHPELKVPKGKGGRILDGQIDAILICDYMINKNF